ncbi:MAG: ribosome recycling factor [Bacteroidia bacterium]
MKETKQTLDEAVEKMKKAIEHLRTELSKIRAGRANPQMLEDIKIDYYGNATSISHVGTVNTPDARTITVQPWEKQMIATIEKAIMNANLGLNPQNDGNMIRINLPVLTEERRQQLVKLARNEAELAKISIRSARKEANEEVRNAVKDGLPEDEAKRTEDEIQKLTDQYSLKVDESLAAKEKDITTV